MTRRTQGTAHARLLRLAEQALRRNRPRREVESLLERLSHVAPEGSEAWTFAHRHLAELLIEEHPWRAALHLRRLVAARTGGDVAHALLGLCHALLGNFQAAVASYRRALQESPHNPWYHHNLGHLLDVALGRPDEAVGHLEIAHRIEPLEHEIAASLAHCLARLGRLDRARTLADEAVRAAPRNRDHRELLAWIEQGADRSGPPRSPRTSGLGHRSAAPHASGRAASPPDAVVDALEARMGAAGFSASQIHAALALWRDFRHHARRPACRPESYAAAIEYAIAVLHGVRGVTQASVARRYGVTAGTVSNRFIEIRYALALVPGDPRYAGQR
ncbi:MAG: tetratricopeptide repeat protein [Myxococcota bacterium]|nr:tetratricopeptide repeat protein [Myxococcota bacterium]MDW8361086.1 tetratricopeptide repeat protein [Myxococcales bacterium]